MSTGVEGRHGVRDLSIYGDEYKRKISRWLKRCVVGIRPDKKQDVFMALLDLVPREPAEVQMIRWDTYMPPEAVTIIQGNRSSQRPTKSNLRKAQSSGSMGRGASLRQQQHGGPSPTIPRVASTRSRSDPFDRVGSILGVKRVQSIQTSGDPNSFRHVESPGNNNTTSVREARERRKNSVGSPQRDSQRRGSQHNMARYASNSSLNQTGNGRASFAPAVTAGGGGELSSSRKGASRPPRGIVTVEGEARVGRVIFATFGTTADTSRNIEFIPDTRARVSWWVEKDFDLTEVQHLRDIPEFPLTNRYLGHTVVCRYTLTGLLKGEAFTGEAVEAVTRPVQPSGQGRTPRMKVRNLAQGSLAPGEMLTLPELNNPITELPMWHFVIPRKAKERAPRVSDTTENGISSSTSDSPDVSIEHSTEEVLPEPMQGDWVVLTEEHAGYLVQLRLSLQGGPPLSSEVGIVEGERVIRPLRTGVTSKPKPKVPSALRSRPRSGSNGSRCSSVRSRASSRGSLRSDSSDDGIESIQSVRTTTSQGPRVSFREPQRPPTRHSSFANPTPRSLASDDVMDTLRSPYDLEAYERTQPLADVPELDMDRVGDMQDRMRKRLQTNLDLQQKKDKEREAERQRLLEAARARERERERERELLREQQQDPGSPQRPPRRRRGSSKSNNGQAFGSDSSLNSSPFLKKQTWYKAPQEPSAPASPASPLSNSGKRNSRGRLNDSTATAGAKSGESLGSSLGSVKEVTWGQGQADGAAAQGAGGQGQGRGGSASSSPNAAAAPGSSSPPPLPSSRQSQSPTNSTQKVQSAKPNGGCGCTVM